VINFLEYWEIGKDKTQHFCWVTDFTITKMNAFTIMRGGRARWKVENETFNTLKNQGYHFEHNFGHGKKHLSVVFAVLMMLAFLVDQVQQLACELFQAVLHKKGSRRRLWEHMRALFKTLEFKSMKQLGSTWIRGVDSVAEDQLEVKYTGNLPKEVRDGNGPVVESANGGGRERCGTGGEAIG
jgi:hypothetical protein